VLGRVLRTLRTPLTLLVLLGILIYGAYWGWTNVVAPPPPPQPKPCVTQKVAGGKLKTSQVTVHILNGGKVRGLAGTVAQEMRAKGFKTSQVDNTEEAVTTTVIVGASKNNPEVKLVLSFFKKAKVREDKRSDRSVTVLVGDKYAGFNTKAKTSITVKAKTVCLPGTPTPSALN